MCQAHDIAEARKGAKMLTNEQKKLIELSKKAEETKSELKILKTQIAELLNTIGVGSSFKDPIDGVVFEIVIPKGRFVDHEHIGYERTKREGERAGSLSMKRAKELGY